MNDSKNGKKLSIDIFLFIFIFYVFAILVGDYFVYFLHLPYFLSIIIGFIGSGLLYYFIKHKIKIVNDIDKSDIIFYICLAIICSIIIVKYFSNFSKTLMNIRQFIDKS